MENERRKRTLTAKEKKQLEKRRKKAAKQAQNYHKLQEKEKKISSTASSSANSRRNRQASVDANRQRATYEPIKRNKRTVINHNFSSSYGQAPSSNSRIADAVNSVQKDSDIFDSREEKFRYESEKKIRSLAPQDYDDGGYYVDEFTARKKQERRAREIRNQESETIRRPKKHLTPKQVKRRRILTYSAIFIVVLIIGTVLSLTVLFKTEKIEVKGDKYYYEDQIIGFSNVELQQNIFIAKINSTPKTIINNLPYVEDVKIGFNIPDTITINVTNAVPSYVISNGGEYLVISSKGRILDNTRDKPKDLPELTCDELKSTRVGDYVSFSNKNIPDILDDISESLIANDVKNITGFDVTDTANITLNYDNRILINLGLPEDIDYKIKTAMTIISEKLDPNNTRTVMGTLDVSSCSTTKVSRYKPIETQPVTVAPTTSPPKSNEDNNDENQNDDNYTWNEDGDGEDSEPDENSDSQDNQASNEESNQDENNDNTNEDEPNTEENNYNPE